ncbi:hypothetical protein C0995_003571, partial [Termitomyces sp. Mi166
MDQNCNLQFVVQRRLSTGQKPVQGPTGDTPVTKENRYAPRAGQPVQKGQDGPLQVNPPKVAFGGDAGHKPNCKLPKAQVRAVHTAAADSDAESNTEEDQEEFIRDEEAPPEVEDPEAEYDAESVHIDGDEYVTVD